MKNIRAISRHPSRYAAVFAISLALVSTAALSSTAWTNNAAAATQSSVNTFLIPGDVIAEWNQEAITRVLASGLPAPRQLRAMSIVQVSVNDAVNGLTRRYSTYLPSEPGSDAASVDGAAIAAAYRSIKGLSLPNQTAAQQAALDQRYLDALMDRGIATDDPGVEYGANAAASILALRATDGNAQAACPYVDRAPDPGVWQRIFNPLANNTPAAAIPCFGNVTPWVLRSASQFPIEPPPALDSDQYARDFNEVKSVGELMSNSRLPDQTDIANFWNGAPADIWNQALRQVVASRNIDISSEARAFALVYMSGTDAAIACWAAKYNYLFWRPTTAINRADEDGNPNTDVEVGWTSFLQQWLHQHPEYPSGHATNSSALGSEMSLIFGDEPGIVMTPTITGLTRHWDSFDQAIGEVVDARVYSGIHFRTTTTNSAVLGRQIAQFVFTHSLRPCKGRGSRCS
jgi:hypothetical protein